MAMCDSTEEEWQVYVTILQNATKRTQSTRKKARHGKTVQHSVAANPSSCAISREEQICTCTCTYPLRGRLEGQGPLNLVLKGDQP